MQLRILACSLAMFGISFTSAAAAEPRLGTPEVITSFAGESNLLAASSIPGHPDAYAVFYSRIGGNVYSVVHRDSNGHAHRFDIHVTRGTYPEAIRIVALEAGGGMAIWDESRTHRVLARSWKRDGTLGSTQVVLSQVATIHSAENDFAQWRVRADSKGTVVVATTGAAPLNFAGVFAAVRDPGRTFGAQQELTPPNEPAIDQRQITISPIAPDGSVAVSWGPEYGDGAGGRAIRNGRAARFGAPEAHQFTAERGLTATNRTILADDWTPITISARVARRCPCLRPQVFRWSGGRKMLAFQVHSTEFPAVVGNWYVARPNADGVFDEAVLATQNAASMPVRRKRAREVGFARFDTSTDSNLFRRRSRLIVVPFGDSVPPSRRAPRLRFGTYAYKRAGRLLVPVYCDRVCGVHGSSGHVGRLPVTDSEDKRIDAALEPFSVAYLRVTIPAGRAKARVSLSASDDAGHRSAAQGTFVRGSRARLWCLAGASGC
ncbi:MAG: hypothetical protein QOI98_1697 [Solirubrobacteraceae bacterium]|nr:hypothetical protein [Solirubrobacteraceae bacterium]